MSQIFLISKQITFSFSLSSDVYALYIVMLDLLSISLHFFNVTMFIIIFFIKYVLSEITSDKLKMINVNF